MADKRELDVQGAALPLMEMRRQRDARSNQDRDRGERAPTESARDRAPAVAVIVGATRGHDHRYQEEQIVTDEVELDAIHRQHAGEQGG